MSVEVGNEKSEEESRNHEGGDVYIELGAFPQLQTIGVEKPIDNGEKKDQN
jgi:hypothetical protein